MKRWIKWTLAIAALGGIMAVPTTMYFTMSTTKKGAFMNKVAFDVSTNMNIKSSIMANVYDARYNDNAKRKLDQFAKGLNQAGVQRDFTRVLSNFYKEFEFDNKWYEIEIKDIFVAGKNSDGSFKLNVKCEIEDKKTDKEWNGFKQINWRPKLTLLSDDDIKIIKKQILMMNDDKDELDVNAKDIKEIFFGEYKEDLDSDFGIFDHIKKLNSEYNNMAYVVAYEIDLADIYHQLGLQFNTYDLKKSIIRVPSISINGSSVILVPGKKPSITNAFKKETTELKHVIDSYINQGLITDSNKIKKILTELFEGDVHTIIEEIEFLKPQVDERENNVYHIKFKYESSYDVLSLVFPKI